jgi:hypothetical protein
MSKLKFFSPTNAHFIEHRICSIKCAIVGEKNFNIIKMHGTTIKKKIMDMSFAWA